MAITPVAAYGRLRINYSTYGHAHRIHFYVAQFLADAAVGTFTAGGTPATMVDLATDIANLMQGIINAAAGFTADAWAGEVHTAGTDNSFVEVVGGAVGAITTSPNASASAPGAVASSTYTFRTGGNKLAKIEVLGAVYVAANRLRLGDLSDGPLNFANGLLANVRVVGRDNTAFTALIANTYDTNDALQGRYRR